GALARRVSEAEMFTTRLYGADGRAHFARVPGRPPRAARPRHGAASRFRPGAVLTWTWNSPGPEPYAHAHPADVGQEQMPQGGCPYRYTLVRVRTTQRKGDIATSRAIASFTA